MIFRKCVLFRPMLPLRHTDGGHLKEFVQRTLSFPLVNEGWPPEAVERPARANGGRGNVRPLCLALNRRRHGDRAVGHGPSSAGEPA
jgi:hypothetical protein